MKIDKNLKEKLRQSGEQIRLRETLRWRLTLFVFLMLILSGLLTALIMIVLLTLFSGVPWVVAITLNPISLAVVLLLVCSIFGTLLSSIFGKDYLRPLKRLIAATEEVKKGNFKVQVEQIEESPSEMGMLINSFNEMTRELDGIELFRNDFINNFSHEFKTPIVSIRGFAKELEIGDLSVEQRQEYAHIIAEEADRLSKLAINVLELSRLENQQIVTDKSEFYLDEQLRQCILLQESAWGEKEIEMVPELDEVRFYGNEELLSHIWTNLIGNAIKFTPPCGTVQVGLSATEREVTVTVSDTGEGMNEEVRSHVFEKFYQGDGSHHHKGYGIGLTMAKRAAELCGGSISVKSAPGEGSVFTVVLPRVEHA